MTLIDTHSHIYLPEFSADFDEMLNRVMQEGVTKILLPAIDAATHEAMLASEAARPDTIFSMMGLHPCSVKENYRDELKVVQKYLEKRNFKAVGETGLDFYWDKTYAEQQYIAFRQQIEWALKYTLPVVIHSRESVDECIRVIGEYQKGSLKGVFHCFSGTAEQAKKIIDLGFYLGIGGVITFKNSGLDKVMEQVDLQYVVLETDAPYLAPVPFRGKRNEPAYIKYVAEKLALVKNIPVEQVAGITTGNAQKLFSL